MDLLGAYSDSDEDASTPQQAASSSAAAASASPASEAAAQKGSKAAKASSAAAAAASSSSAAAAAAPASSASASSSSASALGPSSVDAAPDVPLDSLTRSYFVSPAHNTLYFNPRVDELYAPLAGPLRPGQKPSSLIGSAAAQGLQQNHQRGFVEKTHMSNYVFEENYHSFVSRGVAVDPSIRPVSGDEQQTPAGGNLIFDSQRVTYARPGVYSRVLTGEEKAELKRKRKAAGQDPSDVTGWAGPWAARETEEDIAARKVEGRAKTEEQEAEAERVRGLKKRKNAAAAAAAAAAASGHGGAGEGEDEEAKAAAQKAQAALESSTFHGAAEFDYQGRSYMSPPSSLSAAASADLQCYLPKRLVHTFTGHTKGVNAIRFFPTTGHLLLSASNDKTVKLWNVVASAHGGYKCLRTFNGHQEAVRGIDFNHDGSRFTTCSYDKWVKVWDTETGQCVSRHSTGKIPFCARMHPDPAMPNDILVGQQNKLIVQWDARANEVTQTYNEHLGAVNSVTFIDGNRRFVSSSDDKKIFIWEYGIPVVIKHIAEPDMHSMPYIAVHPSGKYFVGQSQDNQLLCFTAQNKYKLKRDKRFIGHLTAGYACEIGFSPDGSYIMSGDAQGRVVFWDWKTSKVFKKLKCHDQVTIGCQWNPLETSKMATCSWDGTIKYWD